MIAPRSNLLWWAGGCLVPLSLAAAAYPDQAALAWTGAALLMLVPVLDALWARRSLRGLEVGLPELVRLTKDVEGDIDVRILNKSGVRRRIRLAVSLPMELGCRRDDQKIDLPADAEWSSISMGCFPSRRGSYQIGPCYLGATTPLGFWMKRKTAPVEAEVRVYPNLLGERRRLAGVFLTRGTFGIHAQRQIGQGRDFEKLREYVHGDSYGEIHWKATAKRGRPVTKVFQLERTQEVYVVVDSSRLSAPLWPMPAPAGAPAPATETDGEKSRMSPFSDFSDGERRFESTTLERFITAALVLGMVAETQGDLFGVMSFSDRVDRFVRARNGKAHYRACREALYALQPTTVSPDFSELFSFIRLRMRRRALLVFLTSLDDPIVAEQFADNVSLIARHHLILVNMIQPPDVRPLFAGGGDDVTEGDDIYRHLGGHLQFARLREIEKTLHRLGVRLRLVENESLCPQLVSQYVNVKRRQLL